jgi:predicted 2-oxoglutarate/Fe(II)-dependent dioxygenase YbiX
VWATQGNTETGVESSESGVRRDVIDYQNKKRRDHEVTDAQLLRLLTSTVGRRVMPEVQRAFHYRATRFEGFKITCYDAEGGGFFRAHRDNLSPSTAHRRFALTLNLNDDYTGGHLIFPEFGPHRYRPSAGDAIAFSSSFLHEVQPVTRGRRFTLLSFLFHEEQRG